MYTLDAQESLIGDVYELIETSKIEGVEVHRPFLGKAVIRCSTKQSAEFLRSSIEGLRVGQ